MFGNKELQVLFHMYRGKNTVAELSEIMDISMPEMYRKIRSLRSKHVIDGKDPITISCCPFAKRLLALMSEGPGMAKYFSGSGLEVLISILRPGYLKDIVNRTGLSESHIRKILKMDLEGKIIQNVNGLYGINDDECPKIRPFLVSYVDYTEVSDPRISDDSEIIFRDRGDVVFSSTEDQGYRPTGVTAFKQYGMTGMSEVRGFYTTRKGELDMDTVFRDAIRIAEAENDWRLRMANELFYIKNKDRLKPPAKFQEIHERIMSGEHIKRWPSRQDLEDRMWMVSG